MTFNFEVYKPVGIIRSFHLSDLTTASVDFFSAGGFVPAGGSVGFVPVAAAPEAVLVAGSVFSVALLVAGVVFAVVFPAAVASFTGAFFLSVAFFSVVLSFEVAEFAVVFAVATADFEEAASFLASGAFFAAAAAF